ncbi:unnamed protein product [Choristocarpus tenellus]
MLQELREEGSCCDLIISVGEQSFKAHRCVLAAQSQPLRTMLQEGVLREGKESILTLTDVDPGGFSLLMDFLYNRRVEISVANVEDLLDLGTRYAVKHLRLRCCAFLARSVNPTNACNLLALADRHDCHRLRRDLLSYVLKFFMCACRDTSAEEGFCLLPVALVVEVLSDDRLNAQEVEVFWAAVAWIGFESLRSNDAGLVLPHVRFGLISAETLAETVENHVMLQADIGRRFIHEAYRYQALPEGAVKENFLLSMEARSRPRSPSTGVAGGGDRVRENGEGRVKGGALLGLAKNGLGAVVPWEFMRDGDEEEEDEEVKGRGSLGNKARRRRGRGNGEMGGLMTNDYEYGLDEASDVVEREVVQPQEEVEGERKCQGVDGRNGLEFRAETVHVRVRQGVGAKSKKQCSSSWVNKEVGRWLCTDTPSVEKGNSRSLLGRTCAMEAMGDGAGVGAPRWMWAEAAAGAGKAGPTLREDQCSPSSHAYV